MNWVSLISQFVVSLVLAVVVGFVFINVLARYNRLALWKASLLEATTLTVLAFTAGMAGGWLATLIFAIFAFAAMSFGLSQWREARRYPQYQI